MPTADDFRAELYKAMHEAIKQGKEYLDISAGELHRRVGDYPGPDHRMPNCCEVMKAAMAADYGDAILEQPLRGQGASLTIRYVLPRPA
jgi:hypothetical protein